MISGFIQPLVNEEVCSDKSVLISETAEPYPQKNLRRTEVVFLCAQIEFSPDIRWDLLPIVDQGGIPDNFYKNLHEFFYPGKIPCIS